MTLSEEAYRQEIVTYVTTPCIERAVDDSPMAEYFSGKDFVRLLETETAEPFGTLKQKRDEMISRLLEIEDMGMVKERPEQTRKVWYKMMQKACVQGLKESFNRSPVKDNRVTAPTIAQPRVIDPPVQSQPLNRDKLWDRMKELDDMVAQQVQGFEEAEQERLHAVAKRRASVPDTVRQETLQRCQKKFERIEKAGFGGGSWSLLQSCVSTELDAYLDLKQTYGDSLSDSDTGSTR